MQHALLLAELLTGQIGQHICAAKGDGRQDAVDATAALVSNGQR